VRVRVEAMGIKGREEGGRLGGPLEHQPEGGLGIPRSVGFSGACHLQYLLEATRDVPSGTAARVDSSSRPALFNLQLRAIVLTVVDALG
jgi:hypothetical protein